MTQGKLWHTHSRCSLFSLVWNTPANIKNHYEIVTVDEYYMSLGVLNDTLTHTTRLAAPRHLETSRQDSLCDYAPTNAAARSVRTAGGTTCQPGNTREGKRTNNMSTGEHPRRTSATNSGQRSLDHSRRAKPCKLRH